MAGGGSFTPEERLAAFCRVTDAARERRAIKDGTLAASVTYSVEQGGPETVTADHGDDEDFRSLMLDVRKFVLNDEAASFNAVANVLHTKLTDDDLRDAAAHNRAAWNEAMRGNGVLHGDDGAPIRADRMFQVVTYGGMFHDDLELIAEWDGLDPLFQAMYRAEVTTLVTRCVEVAAAQCNLIQKALNEGKIDLS
jgi:hypothetical protein